MNNNFLKQHSREIIETLFQDYIIREKVPTPCTEDQIQINLPKTCKAHW
jgi:hypothetical protein